MVEFEATRLVIIGDELNSSILQPLNSGWGANRPNFSISRLPNFCERESQRELEHGAQDYC